MRAIINAKIYDYDHYLENAFVIFDEKILKVGEMNQYHRPDHCEYEMDLKGNLLLPALVNGHSHLYGAYLRAWVPPVYHPLSFRENLQQSFWPLDEVRDNKSSYYGALGVAIENIQSGVTMTFDHHASGEIIGSLESLRKAWCEVAGLRGVFCFETSDRFPINDCIEENVTFGKEHPIGKDPFCAGVFGMHASMTVSDETLKKVGNSIGEIPIHVHVAESFEDQRECIGLFGKRITERFIDSGIAAPHSIFAHCVNINEKEAYLMGKNEITAAMNTTSNLNCGHGTVDYRMLRRFGVCSTIGNDSLGTNIAADSRFWLYSQHTVAKNVFNVSINDLLKCINNAYSEASYYFGIPIGKIREGYAADFLSHDYIPYTPMNEENVFCHVVDGLFAQWRPRNVWCAGKQKLCDYEVLLDREKICTESRKQAVHIWEKVTPWKGI